MSSEREPPRLTALRRAGPGKVALEVDGRPWRVVADEVVLRAGLAAGDALERPLLRRLRAELRRAEALATAGRMLARRDLSGKRLQERLRRSGVPPATERSAVAVLAGAGVVDDARLARSRAGALASRGWGDGAIVFRLEREGIDPALARAAVGELPSEGERAAELAAAERDRRRAAGRLARRGFSEEAIESALACWTEHGEAGYDSPEQHSNH